MTRTSFAFALTCLATLAACNSAESDADELITAGPTASDAPAVDATPEADTPVAEQPTTTDDPIDAPPATDDPTSTPTAPEYCLIDGICSDVVASGIDIATDYAVADGERVGLAVHNPGISGTMFALIRTTCDEGTFVTHSVIDVDDALIIHVDELFNLPTCRNGNTQIRPLTDGDLVPTDAHLFRSETNDNMASYNVCDVADNCWTHTP